LASTCDGPFKLSNSRSEVWKYWHWGKLCQIEFPAQLECPS
jgi:hypothetical protein